MNLDSMRRYPLDSIVDAVVIGTGAGGAPLLARLARAGLKVVALEAGRHWKPMDHTPDELAASELYWLEDRLSDGAMPQPFGGNNSGIGVGGSTLHWGAFTPRPDARDLRLKTTSGEGVDWPIEHAELLPYVIEVERFVGVSGPTPYPWDPLRRYVMPPVARNASAMAMADGCSRLGLRATDAPAAVLSQPWEQAHHGTRPPCVNCGACHQGCRNGAKTSMDVTYLPLAVAASAEIRAECRVHGIERDAQGRIQAVVYRRDGVDHRQRCANVFLCGGGVESPRLLLHLGLGNASGQVGRNFMAHVATQVWGRFDAEMHCYRGYPSSLISEDMVRAAGADFAGGYLMQSLGVQPVTWATGLARSRKLWGSDLVKAVENYRFMAGIGINGECLPQTGNRLRLADEVDAVGVPLAHVTFGYGANERAIDEHAVETMTAIWTAAGAHDIFALARSAHTLGTCRMGDDDATSVVDAHCRSHEIDNLWICDGSVFPSSLSANPALTIMALSLRTADRFLADR